MLVMVLKKRSFALFHIQNNWCINEGGRAGGFAQSRFARFAFMHQLAEFLLRIGIKNEVFVNDKK